MNLQPMSEDAIDELEQLLETRAVPHGGMSLEMLDGYLSALVVGPRLVMPSHYLPKVWGDAPAWDSMAEASQGMSHVLALQNHIVWRVAQPLPEEGDEDVMYLMPLLQLPEPVDGEDALSDAAQGFPVGCAWATGFLEGLGEAQDDWDRWLAEDEELGDDLEDLARLSLLGADHATALGADPSDVPTAEERWEILAQVPGLLQYCNEQRLGQTYGDLQDTQPMLPIRRELKTGRNDPCPRGSGRKFKKCCGASVN